MIINATVETAIEVPRIPLTAVFLGLATLNFFELALNALTSISDSISSMFCFANISGINRYTPQKKKTAPIGL